jgi:hypothetical protein
MKVLLKKCIVFCLGLAVTSFLTTACRSESATDKSVNADLEKMAQQAYPPEDDIDFAQHAVSQPDGYHQMDAAHDSILISCNPNDTIRKIVEIIKLEDFKLLKDSAESIPTSSETDRIYALRFIYGMGEDKLMKLIFQPLILKRTSPDNVKTNATYDVDSCVSYFKYDYNKGFEIVSKAYTYDLVNRYTKNIKFVTGSKKGHKVCRDFIQKNDSTGDVKRVIYSFSETTEILKDHESTELYVLSAAKKIHVGGEHLLKHMMLLGSLNLHFIDKGIFFQKFGNLSHLCPPSCNIVQYNLKKS